MLCDGLKFKIVNQFVSCRQLRNLQTDTLLHSSLIVIAIIVLSVATYYQMVDKPDFHQRTGFAQSFGQLVVLTAWHNISRRVVVHKSHRACIQSQRFGDHNPNIGQCAVDSAKSYLLNPNYDRLDYGQILTPPTGCTLDFAIGTTYSLDLDALVGASLALGLSEETDSILMNNPVCLLEALRSTGDKVALFCEGGQIHLPSKVTSLYILLEKMVFYVKTDKQKTITAYPSFHPKFWLIRYKNTDGELFYRIVVLSRNLTFDRSWDISFYMNGRMTRRTPRCSTR